jgi:hypothetical protein
MIHNYYGLAEANNAAPALQIVKNQSNNDLIANSIINVNANPVVLSPESRAEEPQKLDLPAKKEPVAAGEHPYNQNPE